MKTYNPIYKHQYENKQYVRGLSVTSMGCLVPELECDVWNLIDAAWLQNYATHIDNVYPLC